MLILLEGHDPKNYLKYNQIIPLDEWPLGFFYQILNLAMYFDKYILDRMFEAVNDEIYKMCWYCRMLMLFIEMMSDQIGLAKTGCT